MPYTHETQHLRLSENQDRRRKLTEAQKEEIRQLYADGKGSWQALAGKYHVSKSTIGIIVSPERAEKVRSRVKAHWRAARLTSAIVSYSPIFTRASGPS